RHSPDRVALDFETFRETEEIERPLIAMNRLCGLARTNRDYLREMNLVIGGVSEKPVSGAERDRMHHQLAAYRRACDQGSRATCIATVEAVGARLCLFNPRPQLRHDLVDLLAGQQIIDNRRAIAGDSFGNLLTGTRIGQMLDLHRYPLST